MGKFLVTLLFITTGFLLVLLKTYVILSVGKLYQLNVVTQFTFVQMFGIICLIDLLRFRHEPSNDDWEEQVQKILTGQLSLLFVFLYVWGFTFLVYYCFFV